MSDRPQLAKLAPTPGWRLSSLFLCLEPQGVCRNVLLAHGIEEDEEERDFDSGFAQSAESLIHATNVY